MVEREIIKSEGEFISLSYFKINYDENYINAEKETLDILNKANFDFIKPDELFNMPIKNIKPEDLISLMISDKKIIKINDECITSKEIYNKAKDILIKYINANGKITAAEYRDLLSTNRKNSIILLEYFDLLRVTRRSDNYRILF
jgi:selenocysteine-specific elongation factor